MTMANDIFDIYARYIEKARKLELERKPGDGLFGVGKKPSDDSCHDEFAETLEKALDDLASSNPSADEVSCVLSFIYKAPSEHRELLSVYWMLNAVHGLTLGLIPRLTPDDAKDLKQRYNDDFPKWERLPVQKQVFSALGKVK